MGLQPDRDPGEEAVRDPGPRPGTGSRTDGAPGSGRGRDEGLTRLIEAARDGDEAAVAALFSAVYDELRALARHVRAGEAGETLNTTALVHEAYFKFVPSKGLRVESRAHFKHIVARAMRQVLVDAARARAARKRGSGEAVAVTLDEDLHGRTIDDLQLLQLDQALTELQRVDSRSAKVVVCRFFGGLDIRETAAALEISTATVKRDWRVARAWLAEAMA